MVEIKYELTDKSLQRKTKDQLISLINTYAELNQGLNDRLKVAQQNGKAEKTPTNTSSDAIDFAIYACRVINRDGNITIKKGSGFHSIMEKMAQQHTC